LNLASGFLFGTWKGVLVEICGCLIGQTAAFFWARTFAHEWIQRKVCIIIIIIMLFIIITIYLIITN